MIISLPPPIMEHILTFMNHAALASMARVNRSWKTIVYRPCHWTRWSIKGTPDLFHTMQTLPSDTPHIGEPDKTCFHRWMHIRMTSQPAHIDQEIDPKRYMQLCYEHWVHIGKPCCQLHHHPWKETLLHRSAFIALNYPMQQRIYYRIVENISTDTYNLYALWLRDRLYLNRDIAEDVRVDINAGRDLDPLVALLEQGSGIYNARKCEHIIMRNTTNRSILNCAILIQRYSIHDFASNEKIYNKCYNKIWDRAGFQTVGSSDTADAAATVHRIGVDPAERSASLVLENGFDPKKPVCALSGDGCAAASITCFAPSFSL